MSRLTLRRVATIQRGAGFPHDDQGVADGELPYFKVSDFARPGNERVLTSCGNWVSKEVARRLRAVPVPSGSVLLPKIGAALLGNARRIVSQPSVFDNNVLAVVPHRVNSRYLHYWLSTIDLAELANPGPIPSLDDEALRDLPFPSASPEAQKDTADFLDIETARIDALMMKKRRMVGLLEERRWALLDELSLVPSGASSMTNTVLKRLASMFTDGDWIESPYITSTGIRLVQTGNIGRGHFRDQGDRYISEATFRSLRCTEVLPGDVLISRLANTVGQACLAPDLGGRMVTSVDVVIMRPSALVDPGYLVRYLSTERHLSLARLEARGTTMQRLARSQVGELPVPMPALQRQRELVDRVDLSSAPVRQAVERLSSQITLLHEHRQALIKRAVTGEMKVAS